MFKKQELTEKPKMEFEQNKLLQKVFNQYDKTFALTLDKADYWEEQYLQKFRAKAWRFMCKSLRKISPEYRKIIKWNKQQFEQKLKLQEKQKRFKEKLQNSVINLKKEERYLRSKKYPFRCLRMQFANE